MSALLRLGLPRPAVPAISAAEAAFRAPPTPGQLQSAGHSELRAD